MTRSAQKTLDFDDAVSSATKKTSSPKVEYDFPADPKRWNHIAFVGEAPGAEEARLGHPFVGRSGQLLDKMLEQAGIERKNSLIANVFRHQPPGNKVAHFFISKRAAAASHTGIVEEFGRFGSSYCRDEYADDLRHLRDTLKALKPKVIVALGRTPLWALTGENELLKKTGKPLLGRLVPGIPVIATFHPSFILRGNWKLQDEWLKHLIMAKDLSN